MKHILSISLVCLTAASAAAYDSGSNGSDGAFAPTADTTLDVGPAGVKHFTTVTIPAGVTVRVVGGAAGAVLLAQGDIVIAGVLDVSGQAPTGASAPGLPALGGEPGPGGFWGGSVTLFGGLDGLGPNPGRGAGVCHAGGGGTLDDPGRAGGGSPCGAEGSGRLDADIVTSPHGGSGGGASGNAAGAGGGGRLVLSSSTRIVIDGQVIADGGPALASGGAGGGGNVRLVADEVAGAGSLSAVGGACPLGPFGGGCGGHGRIRFEAPLVDAGLARRSQPLASVGVIRAPQTATPRLAITSVNNVTPTPVASGHPHAATRLQVSNRAPLAVAVSGQQIAPGTTVYVGLSLPDGRRALASGTLEGTFQSSSATVEVQLPPDLGPGALRAWVDLVNPPDHGGGGGS